jgi:hypothetical protein
LGLAEDALSMALEAPLVIEATTDETDEAIDSEADAEDAADDSDEATDEATDDAESRNTLVQGLRWRITSLRGNTSDECEKSEDCFVLHGEKLFGLL